MAGLRQAFGDKVKSCPAVAELVSARVYFYQAPQSPTYPFIVFFQVDGQRFHSLTGYSGLTKVRYQLDVYAKKATEASAVARELRQCMDCFRGIVSGCNIQVLRLVDEDDSYHEEPEIHRIRQDYEIMYQEPHGV